MDKRLPFERADPNPGGMGTYELLSRLAGPFSLIRMAQDAAEAARTSYGVMDRVLAGEPVSKEALNLAGMSAGTLPLYTTPFHRAPAGALGTFVGSRGAERLAEAGLRHGDDWGGINRLPAARSDLIGGRPADEVWREYGWAPPETWGSVRPQSDYVTTIPDHRLHLDVPGSYAFGKVRDLVRGADELVAAEPGLLDIPLTVNIDPDLPVRSIRGSFSTRGTGAREVPGEIEVWNRSADMAAPLVLHELQHATSMLQKTPVVTSRDIGLHTIDGTEAEELLRMQLRRALMRAIEAKERYGYFSPEYREGKAEMERLGHRLERAPAFAGYLAEPWERQARETAWRMPLDLETNRTIAPGTVDVYSPESMRGLPIEEADAATGVPFHLWRVPPIFGPPPF